ALGAAAHDRDVGRAGGGAARDGDRAVARDAVAAARIGTVERAPAQPLGDIADAPVQPDAGDLADSAVVIGDVDRAPVRGPGRRIDGAVERSGQGPAVLAVPVHHVEIAVLVAELLIVEAGIGDQLAVGRHYGLGVGPVAVGELGDRAAGHIERIDFAVDRIALPLRRAVAAEHDSAAVGGPAQRAAVMDLAEGELARRAAVRGD